MPTRKLGAQGWSLYAWIGATLTVLALGACSDSGGQGRERNTSDVPDATEDPLQGTWLSTSWGLALEASDGVLRMYEITSISCRHYLDVPYTGSEIPDMGGSAERDDGDLLIRMGATDEIRASAISTLPSTCDDGGTMDSEDPRLSFDIFWHNFDEMYASFEIRGVDWVAQYAAFEQRVSPMTTTEELFEILCDMTRPFDDPHVNINHGEAECKSHPLPPWLQDDSVDAVLDAVTEQFYGAGASTTANDLIAYRVLDGNLGYVFVPGMGGFADTPEDDLATVETAMDEIVAAFSGVKGVVIDVRLNGGGDDGIGFAIADRFADKKRLAFSVQSRIGDGWSDKRDYFVEPRGPAQFTGPLVLLTSAASVSAAETFALALRALPHVTVMGETTAGGFSTMMYRNLPDGLEYTVPFERVFANDGTTYEGIGITPDVVVPFDSAAFIDGDDKMLAAAVAYLDPK